MIANHCTKDLIFNRVEFDYFVIIMYDYACYYAMPPLFFSTVLFDEFGPQKAIFYP